MTFYMAARNPYSDPCDYVVSTLLAELHPKPVSVLFYHQFSRWNPESTLEIVQTIPANKEKCYIYKREV